MNNRNQWEAGVALIDLLQPDRMGDLYFTINYYFEACKGKPFYHNNLFEKLDEVWEELSIQLVWKPSELWSKVQEMRVVIEATYWLNLPWM